MKIEKVIVGALIFQIASLLVWFGVVGLIVYVAWHFIAKFW